MPQKMHITPNGLKPCHAQKRTCQYSDADISPVSAEIPLGKGNTITKFDFQNSSQSEFNKFLEDGQVKAVIAEKVWDQDLGKYVETGNTDTLYQMGSIKKNFPTLAKTTPTAWVGETEQVEKKALKLLVAVKNPKESYSISERTLVNISNLAVTSNTSYKTRRAYQEIMNVLEDYNYHTPNAYLTALYNINHPTQPAVS